MIGDVAERDSGEDGANMEVTATVDKVNARSKRGGSANTVELLTPRRRRRWEGDV